MNKNKLIPLAFFGLTLMNQLCATSYSNREIELFLGDMHNFEDLLQTETIQANDETEDRSTLLIASIEAGNLEAVKLLIQHNANPNLGTDAAGQPPLHCAIWNFHINIVNFLLDQVANIDIHQQDDDGVLPLTTAAQGGRLIIDIDDRTIRDEDSNKHIPVCKEIIGSLVSKGADVNAINGAGDTALHCAASWRFLELVKTLLELGADKRITNKMGRTPLDCAIAYEYEEIVKILS